MRRRTRSAARPPRRVVLAGSSGGHLAQLWSLRPWWSGLERTWVTFDTPDARGLLADEESVIWAHSPTTRNVPNLARNTLLAARVIRTTRPDVVVSTGAGAAVPFLALGKMLGATTVFIEVYDRVETPTLTGRLVRPFVDLALVQWPEQRGLYRGSIEIGPLL
ncbi:UDP-N-acetylglucosamine--LPS N-acetylglucosamine transferase [Actinotalea sp.]|uniref:UDP-N-acetylglucosamine--LPS N-acetylglucosamine transferase n=1 Tax=Actinotalea sp. TaxID=1872145 RepID=UPI002C7E5976|nr:UDP-N-acetylglucosamine--LPS N-acetylglucosamine transferase [Actinotalea sp.]HQY33446.1 UDP-N-acetylglucosamine--LPS N-acetylglucosamine transferase [Actinotalea sp.]HRA49955.1 UDP-N-acetylglucosamine--LPS N-acetylglucosamine transferase [Actinotalea sp.]